MIPPAAPATPGRAKYYLARTHESLRTYHRDPPPSVLAAVMASLAGRDTPLPFHVTEVSSHGRELRRIVQMGDFCCYEQDFMCCKWRAYPLSCALARAWNLRILGGPVQGYPLLLTEADRDAYFHQRLRRSPKRCTERASEPRRTDTDPIISSQPGGKRAPTSPYPRYAPPAGAGG